MTLLAYGLKGKHWDNRLQGVSWNDWSAAKRVSKQVLPWTLNTVVFWDAKFVKTRRRNLRTFRWILTPELIQQVVFWDAKFVQTRRRNLRTFRWILTPELTQQFVFWDEKFVQTRRRNLRTFRWILTPPLTQQVLQVCRLALRCSWPFWDVARLMLVTDVSKQPISHIFNRQEIQYGEIYVGNPSLRVDVPEEREPHIRRWGCRMQLIYSYSYWRVILSDMCALFCTHSLPTGILRLPGLKFFHVFPSVVRQMPGYTSKRRGTVRSLPN